MVLVLERDAQLDRFGGGRVKAELGLGGDDGLPCDGPADRARAGLRLLARGLAGIG